MPNRKASSQTYRCFFLNKEDHITAAEFIDCANDEEAKLLAAALLETKHAAAAGFEVWQQKRRIHRQLPKTA
jgi:hypothetical protein